MFGIAHTRVEFCLFFIAFFSLIGNILLLNIFLDERAKKSCLKAVSHDGSFIEIGDLKTPPMGIGNGHFGLQMVDGNGTPRMIATFTRHEIDNSGYFRIFDADHQPRFSFTENREGSKLVLFDPSTSQSFSFSLGGRTPPSVTFQKNDVTKYWKPLSETNPELQ